MPYMPVPMLSREELERAADERWTAILEARPELQPAVALQRRLISIVIDVGQAIARGRLPRLSLPPRYLAAKLARGVPALAAEPIPLPISALGPALLKLCAELAAGGAGEAANHIAAALQEGHLDAGTLLTASLARDQAAIRALAARGDLAPDLVWLLTELAVTPFAFALQRSLFSSPDQAGRAAASDNPLAAALDAWNHGHCPACGSWPALAEVVEGHRTLRCSFCAAAWELTTYSCVYCGESGEPFVTAAPDEERKDRRVEVCSSCSGYLKTVDLAALSPFPLLALADLETMDLDVAAMEHGYARPPLKEFAVRR
jgi:FdhE protein